MGIPDSRALANTTFIAQNKTEQQHPLPLMIRAVSVVSLEPGHYTVSLKEKKAGIGRYGPFEVDVVARPDDEGESGAATPDMR